MGCPFFLPPPSRSTSKPRRSQYSAYQAPSYGLFDFQGRKDRNETRTIELTRIFRFLNQPSSSPSVKNQFFRENKRREAKILDHRKNSLFQIIDTQGSDAFIKNLRLLSKIQIREEKPHTSSSRSRSKYRKQPFLSQTVSPEERSNVDLLLGNCIRYGSQEIYNLLKYLDQCKLSDASMVRSLLTTLDSLEPTHSAAFFKIVNFLSYKKTKALKKYTLTDLFKLKDFPEHTQGIAGITALKLTKEEKETTRDYLTDYLDHFHRWNPSTLQALQEIFEKLSEDHLLASLLSIFINPASESSYDSKDYLDKLFDPKKCEKNARLIGYLWEFHLLSEENLKKIVKLPFDRLSNRERKIRRAVKEARLTQKALDEALIHDKDLVRREPKGFARKETVLPEEEIQPMRNVVHSFQNQDLSEAFEYLAENNDVTGRFVTRPDENGQLSRYFEFDILSKKGIKKTYCIPETALENLRRGEPSHQPTTVPMIDSGISVTSSEERPLRYYR